MALNLSGLRALDTAELNIRYPADTGANEDGSPKFKAGSPTGWIWTVAGPGHPQTLAQSEKIQRLNLQSAKLKEQARANGKKWHGEDKTPSEIRAENVENIAARVVTFTPVILEEGGAEITYSADAVQKILGDPDFGWVFGQVLEFLLDDAAFFPSSAAS